MAAALIAVYQELGLRVGRFNEVVDTVELFGSINKLKRPVGRLAFAVMLHRLAQQQRREIGVAMALGVPPRRIVVRPLLVSAQIALLGVAFGVGIGLFVGGAMQGIMEDFVPLPI